MPVRFLFTDTHHKFPDPDTFALDSLVLRTTGAHHGSPLEDGGIYGPGQVYRKDVSAGEVSYPLQRYRTRIAIMHYKFFS